MSTQMPAEVAADLTTLYEADETAWLERMAALIEQGEFAELDYLHLAEYLADMAKRDRREVKSRLKVLFTHLLKWKHQPNRRTGSWRATIVSQRQELQELVEAGVLRNHAQIVLHDAYAAARELAAAETSLALDRFPAECPFTLDELLNSDLFAE